MAENFSRSVLRVVIAQLSQAVGFHSIHASSLDILTNVLERYLLALGKTVHDYSENCLQTHPHLSDAEFALRQLQVSIPDMLDYMQQMEPVVFPHKVSMFPMPKASNLQFPSGHNPEDFDRDEHIPVYMPSMLVASNEPTEKKEDENVPPAAGQQGKAANFVIAGKHSQDSSSGDDDYSAGELSNEEVVSDDDSLSHNPTKSRHLTKPEDIPTVEGTAPSSMMSVPSSADLDELRGSMSPTRHFSQESLDEPPDIGLKRGRRPSLADKYLPPRKPSEAPDDVPWLNTDTSNQGKWMARTPETTGHRPSWASQPSKQQPEDPKRSSKKFQDKYDADWLHGEPASPVHLTKPPTPDGTVETTTLEKRSWYDEDEKSPKPLTSSQMTPKRFGDQSYPKSKFSQKASTSTPNSSQKQLTKPYSDRKPSQQKHHKIPHKSSKKAEFGDEPIKARIEAAEKLIHSPPVPPYRPSSPKPVKKKHVSQPSPKSPVRSSIEKADKLLKHPLVENVHFSSRENSPASSRVEKVIEKQKDIKQERSSNFASSKSMYDAIDAVINRAVKEDEEARKEAEDAELMKFSHLVKDSSSSDSEPDVTDKAEQMLQLEERGLREARPPTPGSPAFQPPTPLSIPTPQSFVNDEDDEDMTIDTDDESSGIVTPIIRPQKSSKSPQITPKPEKHSKKEKRKKSRKASRDDSSNRTTKTHSSSKSKMDKPSPRPPGPSFVTTETISESKSVKMKVKLKPNILEHNEPKLFDVEKDRDRIRITESKHSKPKEERHKSKDGKHHKPKEHKKHLFSKPPEPKASFADLDQSVEKIILKKSKSGDAKVVKPKIEHKRSPSPPSPVMSRNLPLPKLSAAVPVMSVTAVSKEKEKKKSKKEKKKKKDKDKERSHDKSYEKEKHHERSKFEGKEKSNEKERSKDKLSSSSRRESKDSDSSLMVPKLTLKMGASEKKFVIKQPSASGGSKSSGKKRSHSFITDSPIPAKERKVSVESIKPDPYPGAMERKVITQTISAGPVGVAEDDQGNKIWICPGCNKPDDGSPMIGCDTCDDWYHWPCVKITKEPPDDQDWFCPRCIRKQQQSAKVKALGKKRKKK